MTEAARGATRSVVEQDRVVGVLILADDLIWGTRLVHAVKAAGSEPRSVRTVEDCERLLAGPGRWKGASVIVDLTARAYDGVEAIRLAAGTGARVVAVGQHDDAELRRRALEAGAEKVYTYRALFENGARLLARWLA